MSTLASPLDAQGPPEAAGPAIEDGAGGLIYGHNQTQRVSHEHLRSPEERERDRAEAAKNARCPRCSDLDDATVLALATLIKAAREGRRL